MTNKIQQLIEKIYLEGVVKAKEDADLIIANAKKEASEIIQLAKKKESEIIEQAKVQANEIKKNTDSEIQLAARQLMSKIKQQITNLITTKQIKPSVNESFNDSEFVQNIILTIIQKWNPQKLEELDLKISLPEKDKKEFTHFFESKAFAALNKGVNIDFDSKTKNGFKIGPKDGSYIISFSAQDFESYFKGYFRDKTKKLLFEKSGTVQPDNIVSDNDLRK